MLKLIKPSIVLLLICLSVGLCLAVVESVTRDTIEKRITQDAENKRKEVFNSADAFVKITGWEGKTDSTGIVKEVYKAVSKGGTVGYVFSVVPKGYGGIIGLTVGVSLDGKVTGIGIGENKETPGLGTKASEPLFRGQFTNKSIAGKLEVVKKKPSNDNEIAAISGATITSRGVTAGVQAAADLAVKLIEEEGGLK